MSNFKLKPEPEGNPFENTSIDAFTVYLKSSCIDMSRLSTIEMKDFTFVDVPTKAFTGHYWDEDAQDLLDFNPSLDCAKLDQIIEEKLFSKKSEENGLTPSSKTSSLVQSHSVEEHLQNKQDQAGRNRFLKKKNKKIIKRSKTSQIQKRNTQKTTNQIRSKKGRPTKDKKKTKQGRNLSKELKRLKNQTKNTVKNFGKFFIKFVKDSPQIINRIIKSQFEGKLVYQQLNDYLSTIKNKMSKIENLRGLWTHDKFGKIMRIICDFALRKSSLHWIFNSRIEDHRSPLKYRIRILQFLRQPEKQEFLKWR